MAVTTAADYDILFCVDSTGSMHETLVSLKISLPQIIALTSLTGAFKSISILTYKDYRDDPITSFSGWFTPSAFSLELENPDLEAYATSLQATGGGDYPEAAKTAVVEILEKINPGRKTVVVWYTDAPPHHASQYEYSKNRSNAAMERKALTERGGGPEWNDWVFLAKRLAEKDVVVLPILCNEAQEEVIDGDLRFYILLAELTGGITFAFPEELLYQQGMARRLSKFTVDVLLAWMGRVKQDIESEATFLLRFEDKTKFTSMRDENEGAEGYLLWPLGSKPRKRELEKVIVSKFVDFSIVPKKDGAKGLDLVRKFVSDEEYRKLVYKVLREVVTKDVVCISINPLFGELWRAVCKERANDEKARLVMMFGDSVGKLSGTDKVIMQAWLEESYNYAGEINEELSAYKERFPAIYLDTSFAPTLHTFARSDLLEISRSCQPAVLKKLGEILTHLVCVESPETLPEHLKENTSIPLSLGMKAFNFLLHLVLPGTMLSFRPAAVLASLCRTLQIPFLEAPAKAMLEDQKGKWLNLECPENFNLECIRILLSGAVLTEQERIVFENMQRYKMVEYNLDTELVAEIPWTPMKCVGPMGDTVLCAKCGLLRPVSVMDDEGVCGLCACPPDDCYGPDANLSTAAKDGVTNDEEATWVQCSVKGCGAQYQILNPHLLRVKPKCYYCRKGLPCPSVECTKCRNKVIAPEKYRKPGQAFTCVFCAKGTETIVEEKVKVKDLMAEIGTSWIGIPEKLKFENRSLFAVAKARGIDAFLSFPSPSSVTIRHCAGKHVFNPETILSSLETYIRNHDIQHHFCTLCFEPHAPRSLHPACGRKGCNQRLDATCLRSWYGSNSPGKLLNVSALCCPFCRRKPMAKRLRKWGFEIRAAGGLDAAVKDNGAWWHAWCVRCGFFKRVLERACGAALEDVDDWRCAECVEEEQAKVDEVGNNRVGGRACPGCGVWVVKVGGCNHITCACGTHFCYSCGFRSEGNEERGIYVHMMKEHGGFYDVGDDDTWDESEDDEDEVPDLVM